MSSVDTRWRAADGPIQTVGKSCRYISDGPAHSSGQEWRGLLHLFAAG